MNNWKSKLLIPAMLVLMSSVFAVRGQPPPTATNSVAGSRTSDTRAKSRQADPAAACSAAVDDLIATRKLVEALEAENVSLNERLETEKRAAGLLSEISETRKSEADALRAAVAAKNETIAAKDSVIAAQDKLIGQLKTKRASPWRRLGDILIGAAVTAILK